MTTTTTLDKLLDLAAAEEARVLATLSDEEKTAGGALDDWSAKDILGHIASWKLRFADRLSPAQRESSDEWVPDLAAVNDVIYAEYRDKSIAEVAADLEAGTAAIKSAYAEFSEEELSDDALFPWLAAQPLWQRIGHIGFDHSLLHLQTIYEMRGDEAKARSLNWSAFQGMRNIATTPYWRGVYTYNLACHHAQNGAPERAITYLARAFQLAPDTKAFAADDADLDPIRENPAYQALLAESAG